MLFPRIIHDNKMKNNDNAIWAWCQFNTWKLMKYESFLQFEYIMISCWAPSSTQCHSSHASLITKTLLAMNLMVNFYLFLNVKILQEWKPTKWKTTYFLVCENVTLNAKFKNIFFQKNGLEGYTWMKVSLFLNKLS